MDDSGLPLPAAAAARHGFDVVGVTSGEVLADALEWLRAWLAAGHHADLAWMAREPPRRADPGALLAGVRSVVTVAVHHASRAPPFDAQGRYGRVARYAWGRDYHDQFLPRLRALAEDLASALGAGPPKVLCDTSPFLERAAAARAGLGFFGKNTCLIRPRKGSWFLLGEVFLDVPLPATSADGAEHCGTCARCLAGCPTGALPAPYVLDARRCISYWTIEHRGWIAATLRPRLGAWAFGCDVCQEVCPFNSFAPEAAWPALAAGGGVGPRLDLAATLLLGTDDAFRARFAGTPLLRPRRAGLLRNAAIAARNVGATAAVPALLRCVREDPEPVVRGTALWALAGLDPAASRLHADAGRADPDARVRDEAAAVLEA